MMQAIFTFFCPIGLKAIQIATIRDETAICQVWTVETARAATSVELCQLHGDSVAWIRSAASRWPLWRHVLPFLNTKRLSSLMKRLVIASLMAIAASVSVTETASAQAPWGAPFSPYAFGLPFAYFGGAIQTPPYFATNPPVYYGSRYARPYGISPYPAPPVVNAPADYMGRPDVQFYRSPTQTAPPMYNPFICGKASAGPKAEALAEQRIGEVQFNPFVDSDARIAQAR